MGGDAPTQVGEARAQEDRADPLPVQHHRLEHDQRPVHGARQAALPGRPRGLPGYLATEVGGEQVSPGIVKIGVIEMRCGAQSGQEAFGILDVAEGEGRGAAGAHQLREHGEVAVARQAGVARVLQGRARADDQQSGDRGDGDDAHQLGADREVAEADHRDTSRG